MKYIDAHSHIQMKEYDSDRDAVLSRMRDEDVGAIVVGVDYESSRVDAEAYRALARHPKTVAIGECGLDYLRFKIEDLRFKEDQKRRFENQLELAVEMKKPLMLHVRDVPGKMDAYEDALEILNDKSYILNHKFFGNVHFFAGDWEIAQKFFALGFTVSFTGVITFANQYDGVIKNAPLQNILSETDCPFVAPVPYRGKRNEPVYVKEVVKRVAEIRGEEEVKVALALVENARRVFSL
ncbi:MAG: TatD family hydrolase [Parcubacteria group bacterium]|nr:TatD family hydrolase [Parcubacteria group bacterium]